jgi:hypothetical protein
LAWSPTSKVPVILYPSGSCIHYRSVSNKSRPLILIISNGRCLYFFSRVPDVGTLTSSRARSESPQTNKKAKKSALKHSAHQPTDLGEQAALNRRAQRFQREHELERQKNGMSGGQASLKAKYQSAHLFDNRDSRAASPSSFALNADEPEADPVSHCGLYSSVFSHATLQNVPNWDRFTIVGTNQNIFKDYLRLTTVRMHRPDTRKYL